MTDLYLPFIWPATTQRPEGLMKVPVYSLEDRPETATDGQMIYVVVDDSTVQLQTFVENHWVQMMDDITWDNWRNFDWEGN